MANEWHYTQNGQAAAAPVSADALKQMAAAGQLQPTDMVWKEGMAQWVPAASIKGLFGGAPAGAVARAADVAPQPREPSPKPDAEGGGLMDMHPALVLVLTVCTAGLFGLVYTIVVCKNFAALAAKRSQDGQGRPLGIARHPAWIPVMAYLTLGIYFLYWVYQVMKECSAYTGRKDFNPRVELCLMFAFPLYAAYLMVFRLPDMIKRTQTAGGVPETTALGFTFYFLNPCFCPALPLVAMMYQDSLNQVWFTAK
jgi:hypothetical protein